LMMGQQGALHTPLMRAKKLDMQEIIPRKYLFDQRVKSENIHSYRRRP